VLEGALDTEPAEVPEVGWPTGRELVTHDVCGWIPLSHDRLASDQGRVIGHEHLRGVTVGRDEGVDRVEERISVCGAGQETDNRADGSLAWGG
jgi:hypothetical protein